jgi:betaine-aldehyde dehydrogenase
MIYKPSELTPLTTLRLAEIYLEAGIPPGVFNVLVGDGNIGQLLCQHPKIRKISLTGSVKTGQKVMGLSAPSLKHMTLELGGKSPLILFNDTPIHQAVLGAVQANFLTQGEICSNGTRVFIQEDQHDSFVEALIAYTRTLRIGNPFCKTTQVGALISAAHRDQVLHAIAVGKEEGATLAFGGKIPSWAQSDSFHQGGYYVEPTIFTHCQDSMTLVQEEIFGPVMSILTFKTEEEVIQRANHTPYGLAAGIYTRDIQRAHRMAAQLEVGICWINNYNITPVEVPFGGTKLSGIGRENGPDVIQHYTQVKTVYVEQNF